MEHQKEELKYRPRTSKHQPFDKRLIREIVQAVEEGLPRREAARLHGMTLWTLKGWMSQYGSPAYQATRKRWVKPEVKRRVLQAIDSGMRVREACIAYGIKDSSTIRGWIRQRQTENAELAATHPEMKSSKKKQPPTDQQALEQQLAEAQLKIRALETMIDIAESQLKIDIRKKSGAKQLPK
jgi:transposase